MLTPREKSPLPENVPRGGSNPRRCGQRAQALPTELFRPPSDNDEHPREFVSSFTFAFCLKIACQIVKQSREIFTPCYRNVYRVMRMCGTHTHPHACMCAHVCTHSHADDLSDFRNISQQHHHTPCNILLAGVTNTLGQSKHSIQVHCILCIHVYQ